MSEPTTREMRKWVISRTAVHGIGCLCMLCKIPALCDRLDAEEKRSESLFRQRNDALLRGDEALERLDAEQQSHGAYVRHTTEQLRSQRERLVAAQERIRELEEACAGLRMMKESYKRRLSDLQRETYR